MYNRNHYIKKLQAEISDKISQLEEYKVTQGYLPDLDWEAEIKIWELTCVYERLSKELKQWWEFWK